MIAAIFASLVHCWVSSSPAREQWEGGREYLLPWLLAPTLWGGLKLALFPEVTSSLKVVVYYQVLSS